MDDQFRRSYVSANLIPSQIPPRSLLQGAAQKGNTTNQTHAATAAVKTVVPGRDCTTPDQERSVARNNGGLDARPLGARPGGNLRASILPAVRQPRSGNGEGPSVPKGFNGNGSSQARQSRPQVNRVPHNNAHATGSKSILGDTSMDSYGNRSRSPDRLFRKRPIAFVKAQDPVSRLAVPGEAKKLNDSSSSDEDCGGVALKPKSAVSDLTSKFAAMMQGPGDGAVKKHTPAPGDSSKQTSPMLVTNKNVHLFPYYTGAIATVIEKEINKPSITQIPLQNRVGADATSKDITYKQSPQVPNASTKPGPIGKDEDPIHKLISPISAVSIKPGPNHVGTTNRKDARILATNTKPRPTEKDKNIISSKNAPNSGGNRYGQPLLHFTSSSAHRVPNPPRTGVYRDGELVAGSDMVILWESNKGLKLMMKMGYMLGEGLGRCGEGVLEPVPMVLWKGTFGLGYMYNFPYDCGSEGKGGGEPGYGNERNRFRDEQLSRTGNKADEHHTYPDRPANSSETRYSARNFYERRAARHKFDSILEHHELTHRRLGANEVGELFTWCISFMEKTPGKLFSAEEMETLLKGGYANVVRGARGGRDSRLK